MASILGLVKHYQNCIAKHPDDEYKVLKYIEKLYHLEVTVQHLQETGVGRTVNALRKEPGEVGKAARALVYKWKVMVAAEESDEEDDHSETDPQNGHGNGRDSDDRGNSSRSHQRDHNHQNVVPQNGHANGRDSDDRGNSSRSHQRDHNHQNGDTSMTKRKTHSSEDEEPDRKRSKHSSASNNDNYKKRHVKTEPSKSDSESSSSLSDSDDSESSEEEKKEVKVKIEPTDTPPLNTMPLQISPSNIKTESSSSKRHGSSEHQNSKHSKHSSDTRHSSDKSTSSKSSRDSKDRHNERDSSEKKYQKLHRDESRSSSKNSSEKYKPSSHRSESSSEKERHRSRETSKPEKDITKHSSAKSDKDKPKSDYDKKIPTDNHKSKESKERSSSSKERSSSSKEKSVSSTHSSKSDKRHSSSSDKSKSESKSKSDKSKDRSSEKKSSDKSSPEKSSDKSRSSSSKSKEDKPKKTVTINTDSDDGIGCESGASFAEALGIAAPSKPKKKKHSTPIKDAMSPNNQYSADLSPATLLAPTAKLAPLPALEISALPEISPNYKPRPPPKFLPHFNDEDAMSCVISSKNQRTKVYSGNKIMGKVPSLYEMCVNILQEHIDALEYTGGVPYEILKPVVDKGSPQQLFMLEHFNPYLMEDTDHLWQKHCEKQFRTKKRQEMETWREMYIRCQEEQEHKLKSLTANIRMTQEAKKAPVKQTKMAYVDTCVKPPRNILRKQAQHGTAYSATASPAARVASLAAAPNVLKGGVRAPPAAPVSLSSFNKPKKAPLMAKALQLMRGRKR